MSPSEPIRVRADAPMRLDHPPAHLELSWRPIQVRDRDALHALVEAIEVADRFPERTSPAEVEEMLGAPWLDLEQDSLVGVDHTGTLRAYAVVDMPPDAETVVRVNLRGGVHPRWRGRGIGRAVLAWMEGRGRQRLADSGVELPARLAVMVAEHSRDHRRLYAAAGFSPIRWYTVMRRDLGSELPDAPVPEQLRLAPWTDELDDAVRLAHNEAFMDHWGSQPQSAKAWRQHASHFAPQWSWLAMHDDAVVGYLLSSRHPQDWSAIGYTCGFTEMVGVVPAWRGRGVAAALLVKAMTAYREDGMEYACLLVDTANPTGAHELYDRLGYEPTYGYVLYSVEI